MTEPGVGQVADPMTEGRVTVAPVSAATLRVPTPEGDLVERALAEANRRGVEAALHVLGRGLPDFDLRAIAQSTDASTFAAGRAGEPLRSWLGYDDLVDRVLCGHLLGIDRLKAMRDLEPLHASAAFDGLHPSDREVLNPAKLATHLDRGFTGIFDGAHARDRSLQQLTELTERLFGTGVSVNAYLSIRETPSFGAHWDDHEVIILPVLGRKHWRIERPVGLSMTKQVYGRPTSGDLVWEGDIEPGAALHIPRGWGHLVQGVDELSFHLTVTIPRMSVATIAQDLLRRAAEPGSSLLDPAQLADEAARSAVADRAVAAMRDLDVDDLVGHAVARHRAMVPSRPTQPFSRLLDVLSGRLALGDQVVRAPHGGGVMWATSATDPEGPRTVAIVAGQRSFALASDDAVRLAPVLDGWAHPAATLVGDHGPDVLAVLRDALATGLLELVEDPHAPGVALAGGAPAR